jgi:hypothetical protein
MKVVIDVTAGRLSIEGDGPDLIKVLTAARELAPTVSQISIVTSGDARRENASEQPREMTSANHAQSVGPKTLRQFVRGLVLKNISERIAAIAYYINKIEGRQGFSPKEMDGWFTMCGFQKPSQMPVAMFDTKRKYGYTESTGRGTWHISNQGENLIIAKIEDGTGAAQ